MTMKGLRCRHRSPSKAYSHGALETHARNSAPPDTEKTRSALEIHVVKSSWTMSQRKMRFGLHQPLLRRFTSLFNWEILQISTNIALLLQIKHKKQSALLLRTFTNPNLIYCISILPKSSIHRAFHMSNEGWIRQGRGSPLQK